MRHLNQLHLLPAALILALLTAACASIGRPEGGPKDELPPVFVSSNPAPGERNVSRTTLNAVFDENIQLEDAFNKVVVSPVQKQAPQVTANGRRLRVEFRDTLLPNSTYTIDFADAIKDLNEGNILDGFALDFSTGETLDSLRISGMVLQAENLEPAQGMIVGVYSDPSDTAIRTLPFERIARTNQYGQFTIRGLHPGEYRIYAVNDINRDNHWDRSEDVAFYGGLISPSAEHITVSDTLLASDGTDSIVERGGTRYLPNDILLMWFNENYRAQYLKDYARPERRRITVNLAAPTDSLPELRIVSGADSVAPEQEAWSLRHANAGGDSLEYWIRDPRVIAADSLMLSLRYQKTDSTDRLQWQTDTLRFFFREPKVKKKKEKVMLDSLGDTIKPAPELTYLSPRVLTSAQQELNRPFTIEFPQPLSSIDTAGVRLEIMRDTVWTPVADARLLPDSIEPVMRRSIDIRWEPGGKYRFTADSAAIVNIYGEHNKKLNAEFTVKQPEDYSALILTLQGLDSVPAVVELLDGSDKPVRRIVADAAEARAEFRHVLPGSYYVRAYLDVNGNGKWDTGVLDSIQPEDVFYFAKKIELKKNWDVEQTWNLYELAVDQQKPYAIKTNKPKLKRGEKAPDQDEDDEDDEFGNPFGGNSGRRPGSGGFGGFGGGKKSSGTNLRGSN